MIRQIDHGRPEWDSVPGFGYVHGGGPTVPADGAKGWSFGATFIHTDGSGAGDAVYVNVGSQTSANFDPLDIGATTVADTISESTSGSGVTVDGVLLKDGEVTTGTINEETVGFGVTIDSVRLQDGLIFGSQVDPVAETGAATISAADILAGIVTLTQSTGSTVAMTLDTGSSMDAAVPDSFPINGYIDWSLINLSAAAADTGTVTASSAHTLVGSGIVASAHASTGGAFGNAGRFRSRRTNAETWITYRIG